MKGPIYTNRVINFRRIKAIGFDMDHTLIRYHTNAFEEMTFEEVKKKLIALRKYPEKIIKNIFYKPELAIRGLVLDKKNGNLIKLNLYGMIKSAYHGFKELNLDQLRELYGHTYIDLSLSEFYSVDTTFSIAYCSLFVQLVDAKDKNAVDLLPTYEQMANDIEELVDLSHRDGSLKNKVKEKLSQYIHADPQTVQMLERFKDSDKTLLLITNSDYAYTQALMDYAIAPYLKTAKNWRDLFEYVIVQSAKPRFFQTHAPFLKVDPINGHLHNWDQALSPGIYQGGNAKTLLEALGLQGDEVLYLGDHIFGDILSLKKHCGWRTALVIEEIEDERQSLINARPVQEKIDQLMLKKEELESSLYFKSTEEKALQKKINKDIQSLDRKLADLIEEYNKFFNSFWGETMRSGGEPSRFFAQVEKYACFYMAKVSDLAHYSPNTYFRPKRRPLPHEWD
jgi:HAD superfamily 5'-nucleotidase-like hydrolase